MIAELAQEQFPGGTADFRKSPRILVERFAEAQRTLRRAKWGNGRIHDPAVNQVLEHRLADRPILAAVDHEQHIPEVRPVSRVVAQQGVAVLRPRR
ncbi:MAG: hypothetical protein J5J06_06270 [Phycisphaerae bacterium]|nr:hypothetical protein [Phycisphaerae bacterium]